MKRFIIFIAVIVVAAAGTAFIYLQLTGPRMYIQPNIRAFQAQMPTTPVGAIPVTSPFGPLPFKEDTNPVAKTSENCGKGKVYYGYYCVFCHGDKGDGFGPVGFSYNPVPADLRTAKVQSKSDGELLYSMLTGTGHAPVLQKTVLPEYRWFLVLYVRQLGSQSQAVPLTAQDSNSQPRP